jgi:copper oxidase (laccase) domain-containing protein
MGIRVETSTVADGNMSLRWGDSAEVAANRSAFLSRAGMDPTRLVLCRVPDLNGVSIVEVNEADYGSEVLADALITRAPIALGLLTADCLPVIMHDPVSAWVAIAHCGWKSTDLRLPELLVQEFCARGSEAGDIRVHIGPSIRAASYVRPHAALSQCDDPRWAPFIARAGDAAHVDLHAYVRAQCTAHGILLEHFSVHPSDTFADLRCFSHRRSQEHGEPEGRMLTVVSR